LFPEVIGVSETTERLLVNVPGINFGFDYVLVTFVSRNVANRLNWYYYRLWLNPILAFTERRRCGCRITFCTACADIVILQNGGFARFSFYGK
jgi:hypothetical protein